MKKIACLALLGAFAVPSFATVINFDDLVGQNLLSPGYAGIADWGTWTYYDSVQPPYNPSSGLQRVYNNSDGDIKFGFQATFQGAFLNGNGDGNGFAPESFTMLLGGQVVAQSADAHLDGSGVGVFLNSGYNGLVDEVIVNGTQDFYIMDDFTINAVPEPASLIAMGLGLAAFARKRRANR